MRRPRERRRWWPWSSPHPHLCILALFAQSAAFVPAPYGPAAHTAVGADAASTIGLGQERFSCTKWVAGTTKARRRQRRSFSTATRFTRQQMIDMGLVPPEENEQQGGDSKSSPSSDGGEGGQEEEEEEEFGVGAGDGGEQVDAVGLIGHFEAAHLMIHEGKEGNFVGSLDMSMTERELVSTEKGVALPPTAAGAEPCLVVSWDELAVVLKKAKKGQYGCWELYADGNGPCKVSDISESTSRPAMLCAPLRSPGPPTMVLGGFAMHRISGGDQKSTMEPGLDTEHKVTASGARWTNGRVLDTCTGLGYTAIAAARCKGVSGVVTVELDEVSLRMCSRNPWSRELFDSDKITSLHGDCCELIKDFEDSEFAAIIHDPPARALCKTTDMYGAAFYKELARVLKPGGTLFHYIGNPESKEGGRLFRGVIDRLIGAGFYECKSDAKAFGVVARR